MKDLTILVTGGKSPAFYGIIQAFKRSERYNFRIIGSDWRDSIVARNLTDKYYVLGDNRDPNYQHTLLDVCKKEDVDILIPIRNDEMLPICKFINEFRENFTDPLLVSEDPDVLETILNKAKLYKKLSSVISIPEYYLASTSEELKNAVMGLDYPAEPVCIKPVSAEGSRGFRILDESKSRKQLFFQEKANTHYSTLDRVLMDIGDSFPKLLVTRYFPNKEYTIDVFCKEGVILAIVPRIRKAIRYGITSEAMVSIDDIKPIQKMCVEIIEYFGFSHNIGIQIKADKDGVFQLLEINPRLQGTTIISVEAGVNIPEYMIDLALNKRIPNINQQILWGLELERSYREFYKYNGKMWY